MCITNVELVNHSVTVKSDYSDSNSVVNFEVKLAATALGFSNKEIAPVDDAYSTDFDLNLVYSQTQLTNIEKSYSESCITKATVEAGSESILSIVDLWCEQCSTTVVTEDDNVLVKGKLNMCILAKIMTICLFILKELLNLLILLHRFRRMQQLMLKALYSL